MWFTLSHGILNEVYYPRVDYACIRDLGLIVTDGKEFFSEEKRHADSSLTYPLAGVPLYRLTNSCNSARYRIEKEIIADLSTADCRMGARLSFTFYWRQAGRWEGTDFAIDVA